MKHKFIAVVVVFAVLIAAVGVGGRVTSPAIASRLSVCVFHFLDHLQLDDELAGLSLRLDTLLFSRRAATTAQIHTFEAALDERPRPNDLLIFDMSSYLADRLTAEQARELFLRRIGALRSGGCDRMYLVAALLPVAERAGLSRSRVQDVIDGYSAVGRSMRPGETEVEKCRTYRVAIEKLLQNAS